MCLSRRALEDEQSVFDYNPLVDGEILNKMENFFILPKRGKSTVLDIDRIIPYSPVRKKKGVYYATYKDNVYSVDRKTFGVHALGGKYDSLSIKSSPEKIVLNTSATKDLELAKRLATNEQNEFFVDPEFFNEANAFCTKIYQMYGLLEKGEEFGSKPDLFVAVYRYGKIVATLGYKFSDIPVMKTYDFDFKGRYVNEIMRFSVDPSISYRIEVLPEIIVEKRGEKDCWEEAVKFGKAKKFHGSYYKLIDVRREIGEMLFESMLSFYRNMKTYYGLAYLPDLMISTYPGVVNFFNRSLGKNIFHLHEDAKLKKENIDPQSRIAYEKFGFRLFSIPQELILPVSTECLLN